MHMYTFGDICNTGIQVFLGIEDPADEAHLLGLHGGDFAPREREVCGVPVADNPRQPAGAAARRGRRRWPCPPP